MNYVFGPVPSRRLGQSLGIDTTRYKIVAWTLSAVFTGLAGSVYAYWFTYIDAPTVFVSELLQSGDQRRFDVSYK